MLHNAATELAAQTHEARFGLRGAGTAAPAADGAATVRIVTLESTELTLCLDHRGVRASHSDAYYDSMNRLLLNCSPGFKAAFNASLQVALHGKGRTSAGEDGNGNEGA